MHILYLNLLFFVLSSDLFGIVQIICIYVSYEQWVHIDKSKVLLPDHPGMYWTPFDSMTLTLSECKVSLISPPRRLLLPNSLS